MNWVMPRPWRATISLATALALMLAPALAQTLQDLKCTGNPDIPWDVQIAGCTDAINSGKFTGQNLATLFVNRGIAHAAKGELDPAIADYGEAIRLDPKYVAAFTDRGIAYRAKGDLDRAIADYDQAIGLDPTFAVAFNNRGRAFLAKKDYGRAIADYDQAIRLDPDYADALYRRGKAKQLNGDIAGGNADVGAAEKIDPNIAAQP
jgi:tetratricopeptide (TPR) repeat protein